MCVCHQLWNTLLFDRLGFFSRSIFLSWFFERRGLKRGYLTLFWTLNSINLAGPWIRLNHFAERKNLPNHRGSYPPLLSLRQSFWPGRRTPKLGVRSLISHNSFIMAGKDAILANLDVLSALEMTSGDVIVDAKISALTNLHSQKVRALMKSINTLKDQLALMKAQNKEHRRSNLIRWEHTIKFTWHGYVFLNDNDFSR